jgi:hypothetical protein
MTEMFEFVAHYTPEVLLISKNFGLYIVTEIHILQIHPQVLLWQTCEWS